MTKTAKKHEALRFLGAHVWHPDDGDIDIRIPELNVTVTVSKPALLALAQRSHKNRAKKSQAGPCSCRVTGPRPERFNNCFIVYGFEKSGDPYAKELARRAIVSNVYRHRAEQVFKDEQHRSWLRIELWGPATVTNNELILLDEYRRQP